jgi:hypothetical protein
MSTHKISWTEEPFFSAAEAGRTMGRKAASIIREQPGYRRGEVMAVLPAKSGGRRLYVDVQGQWMDASLQDID